MAKVLLNEDRTLISIEGPDGAEWEAQPVPEDEEYTVFASEDGEEAYLVVMEGAETPLKPLTLYALTEVPTDGVETRELDEDEDEDGEDEEEETTVQ